MSAQKATALPIAVELVASEMPASPLIVVSGDTVQRIENLRLESAVVITDAETAASAGAILVDASRLVKEIDTMRLKLKRPFMDWEARIDAAAKAPIAALNATIATLRPKLAGWQQECERRAAEAERQRQEQIRLAEAERQRAEAAAAQAKKDRLAAIAAAQAKPEVSEFADYEIMGAEVTVEHKQAEAAKLAQASVALQQTRTVVAPPKPQGISFRKLLKFEVTDVQKLPTHLVVVTANDAAIRAQFVTGWKDGDPVPTHAGLRFTVETQTVTATARR